jgi:hypothetical protein
MTSPSETASDHQAVPEDNQNMPEPSWDPAGAIPEGDPRSPAPAASGYPGITAVHSAPAGAGLAEADGAETPFAFSVPPAAEPRSVPETPFAFSVPPAAEPGPAPAEPAARDSTSPGTRWQEIQSMFVDDPRASLQLAAGLVGDSAEALAGSIQEHQHSLLAAWQGDDAGTEELRTTLQQYRTFWNRLEDFSREA